MSDLHDVSLSRINSIIAPKNCHAARDMTQLEGKTDRIGAKSSLYEAVYIVLGYSPNSYFGAFLARPLYDPALSTPRLPALDL